MLTPIIYTQQEIDFIKNKLSEENFNHKSWSDVDLNIIKESIKKHYNSVQGGVCPYCKQQLRSTHGRHWDIEHIIPRSQAPSFMFEPKNLCMSCVDCNSEKSDKKVTNSIAKKIYPIKSTQYSIIHPHLDCYEDYLLVIEAGLFYYPLKPKGRKTIEVCGLNRFYEFAGFGNNEDIFQKIIALTSAASNIEDDATRFGILGEISALALRGVVEHKKKYQSNP